MQCGCMHKWHRQTLEVTPRALDFGEQNCMLGPAYSFLKPPLFFHQTQSTLRYSCPRSRGPAVDVLGSLLGIALPELEPPVTTQTHAPAASSRCQLHYTPSQQTPISCQHLRWLLLLAVAASSRRRSSCYQFPMADLQELFARLNGQGATPSGSSAGNQPAGYRQASVSSPIFSPSPHGPQPHHPSAIMSPNSSVAHTPVPEQSQQQQQSAQLLNLLRFNSQPSASQQARRPSANVPAPDNNGAHGRATSATDLVASFMGKAAAPAHSPASVMPVAREPASMSAESQQNLLLRLLNHPKPAQEDRQSARSMSSSFTSTSKAPETAVDDVVQDLVDAELEHMPSDPAAQSLDDNATPIRVFGGEGSGHSTPFAPETVAKPPKFTYNNPFDQLEAASPRNRTPVSAASRAPPPKMEILKPKAPSPAPALQQHESVADTRQATEEDIAAEAVQELERMSPEGYREIEEVIIETAVEIKKELEDDDNVKALEETLPKPLADSLREVVEQVAQADVVDSWESAETEDSPAKDDEQTVTVFRFPMRAFASITVQNLPDHRATFRAEQFMDVVRMKKEFDQIDRSLVSATKNFIAYPMGKKGGFRIIKQDTGQVNQVFDNHSERIFSIALCTPGEESSQDYESVLGIGVNGSVFWTPVELLREDSFDDNLTNSSLILPPSPSQDDNTSGGQLKTRAKPSSRHPEFFAVGRGKSIHIVWPKVATQYLRPKSRICHTEKYLKERSLRILTGKAGKDFTFSEDDTVIVSLDKAGRMRFWDIRKLITGDSVLPNQPPKQGEVSQTLLEFHTTSPNGKSWPTSIFFFDKDKPFTKGIALRYVMVGMKQNHSFQLWDLGLQKPVQEINLPHAKESDAICSVAFHPKTGIMAVAHPTRNSIFFIHVSCPRYNLPVLNQATYIDRIAKSDRALPSVNATAIMTSLAEYSFASKGEIRSLHMLNDPVDMPTSEESEDDPAFFELYVMHSKGVAVLKIRRSDLGWKKEGEPLNPKEAEAEGVITLSVLKAPAPVADESSIGGDTPAPKSSSERSTRESIKKESTIASKHSMTPEAAMRASTLAKVESKQDAARAAIINGSDKPEKKKKKRSIVDSASGSSVSTRPPPSTTSYAQAVQAAQASAGTKSPPSQEVASRDPPAMRAPSNADDEAQTPEWAKRLINQHFSHSAVAPVAAPAGPVEIDTKKLAEVVQAEVKATVSRELDVLYRRLAEDSRSTNAANGAKHEAVLRLVSTTLTDNVEGVIRKMVDESVRNVLVPQLVASTSSVIDNALAKVIPDSVGRALKSSPGFQSLPDQVAKKVVSSIGPFESTITASVGSIVHPAVSKLTSTVEQQMGESLRQQKAQRQSDAVKITQLTQSVELLTETLQTMASSQLTLQGMVTKLQDQLSQVSNQETANQESAVVHASAGPVVKSEEQLETEAITQLMREGNYEQGTMQWLQSSRTSELFDTVFVRCNPSYLSRVSPLLALSTGAVVTESLDHNLTERLIWLDAVLKNVDPTDHEILDLVPKIMDVINGRLTAAYIQLNENSPGDSLLRRISALVNKGNELSRAVQYQGGRRG
ncbi:hypothetical protein P154DRAFT_533098 [Amniculicola lignicola CBS 123094]|uniref:EDC4-like protein pdc1 beta-propeller domain-containing protein n=1 Tax=Amniculicola lignicola CBS 123094 TaxID=1392246 RepID=A0A6A5WLF6_9PLEO|nr:hypothetical protein P154DRAFT_533098 [Amniculicola lignicola CBS 123094]